MPELPEVETVVRLFRPRLVGRRISGFRSLWPRNVSPSQTAVRRAIVGRTIVSVRRRAKLIVLDLDAGGHLLFHLRMSGRFEWAAELGGRLTHTRAVLELDRGDAVWFVDSRKFGRIRYTPDLAAATRSLGLEPLDRAFTPDALATLLQTRSRQLKPLLLDQSIIAGIGNIYADESLFAAGLHPLTRSDQLSLADARRLHQAIRTTLRKAIRLNGTSIDWVYPTGRMQYHLRVYGRAGKPCPRCGTTIESLRVAQRGTHICPSCQLRPPLQSAADQGNRRRNRRPR